MILNSYIDFFQDFTRETDRETAFSVKSTSMFAAGAVVGAAFGGESQSLHGSSKSQTKVYSLAATMRIERYYSSVREEISPLSADANTLLANQDYVGFFKACGPNYVRSIRRAQEVTAIFQFKSSSRAMAQEWSSTAMAGGGMVTGVVNAFGYSYSSSLGKSKFASINSELTIKIIGFGLGLTQEGSETMVATTMDEFTSVMKFSFNSMTRAEQSFRIGMVYGIEVVPWVHNTKFQLAAKLAAENLEIPLPRSLIPKAFLKSGSSHIDSKFQIANHEHFTCKNTSFKVDKFGFCCEAEQLYNIQTKTYRSIATAEPTNDVCKPLRSVDKAVLKDNMVNNGEFVSRLEAAFRYKLVQIGQIEKCLSSISAIPEKYYFHYLRAKDTVKYSTVAPVRPALLHVKMAVDPKGDYGLVKHMALELDEWVEQFYTPCLGALFGMNEATVPDTDVSYFMVNPWYSHDECMKLSCLSVNMQWDREKGGCIPSLITGLSSSTDKPYNGDDKDIEYCARSGLPAGDGSSEDYEGCKNPQAGFKASRDNLYTDCWEGLAATGIGMMGSISFLIENYCNPQLEESYVWSWGLADEPKEALAESFNTCNNRDANSVPAAIPTTADEEATAQEAIDENDPLTDNDGNPVRRRRLVKRDIESTGNTDEFNALNMAGGGDDVFIANLKRRIEFSRNNNGVGRMNV